MSFLEFPFKYSYIKGIGSLFYPVCEIQLKTLQGWKIFEFLVDTGADTTTIPAHLLPVLGLKKSKLKINKTSGIGGISVKSWEFFLPLKLGERELSVHACAIDSKNDSMPLLLGRKDIFEKAFNLTLDSKRKVTIIEENICQVSSMKRGNLSKN